MLELWGDFRLLANDKTDQAYQSIYLAGALPLLRKRPDAKLESKLKGRFGVAFDSAHQRMVKRPFAHWSGTSRKAVVERQCGPEYSDFYQVLSWDCHRIIQVALDSHAIDAKAGKYQLRHRQPQAKVATKNCVMTTHVLREMWNELIMHAPPS